MLAYNVAGAVRGEGNLCHVIPGTPTPNKHCYKAKLDGLDDDGFRFVDVLADRIAAERPQLVALQEMCGSQVIISKRPWRRWVPYGGPLRG